MKQQITYRKPSFTLLTALLSFSGVFPAPASAQVPGEIAALVKKHCVDCHSGDKPEAGLNLAALKFETAEPRVFATWVRIHDQLASGEMPPADAAIATHPSKKLAFRRTGKEVAEKHDGIRTQLLGKYMRLDGERLNVHIDIPWHMPIQSAEVPTKGRYRLKVVAQALNTGDRPVPLNVSVLNSIHERGTAGRTLATFDAPPDRPGVFELEVVLGKLNAIRINAWQFPGESTEPGYALELMELEGPLGEFPPPSHKRLFGDLPLKPASVVKAERAGLPPPEIDWNRPFENPYNPNNWQSDPLIPVSTDPQADGQRLLREFLPRAMRRPVDDATLAYYIAFFQERLDKGDEFHTALRSTYKAILSSPHFFYFREQPGPLDDYAIASRLSCYAQILLSHRL